MKITELQRQILAKMRLVNPMTGAEIKRACGHEGTNRAFANALIRMRDKGLIEVTGSMAGIAYIATEKGLNAFLDAQAKRRGIPVGD